LKPAGIYIHIPFCRSRCSYCDFATGPYDSVTAQRYVDAVSTEIKSFEKTTKRIVDTIYFGGGTPSLLSPDQVRQLLVSVEERFTVSDGAEVTMEMNPGTVTLEKLEQLRRLGVNRASFGAQTFDDLELARLGRSHTAFDTRQTFKYLRNAGFDNVSFDLIGGLPGQTLSTWKRNLDEAFSMAPEHLSFYLLEVHQGTPLATHIERGIQPKPDDDLAAQMYELMLENAGAAGYQHYEISNLCLPGFESRHNTKYWKLDPYFGFGCSAHSFDGISRRWANERDVMCYVELVETEKSPVVAGNDLTQTERESEAVFLGLRLMRGIDLSDYQNNFGTNLGEKHRDDLERFRQAGLIEYDGEVLKLTKSGALLSNEVFAAFV
jgi:oxygen-independent coproporphyrinogen III oxidase